MTRREPVDPPPRVLTDADVEASLADADLVGTIEQAVRGLQDERIEVAPRVRLGVGPDGEVTHIRSSRDRVSGGLVVKATDYDPARGRRGGVTLAGSVTWSVGGVLHFVAPAAAFTAARTLAATAFVLDHLPVVDAPVLAVIGAGVQARAHVHGVARRRQVREVRIHSRRSGAHAFVEGIGGSLQGVPVRAFDDPGTAVRGADIVIMATTSSGPIDLDDDLGNDTVLVLLGGGTSNRREVGREVLARAVTVVADDLPRVRDHGSEVAPAIADGSLQPGRVIGFDTLLQSRGRGLPSGDGGLPSGDGGLPSGDGGLPSGDQNRGLRIYKSVGAAWEDLACAALLAERIGAPAQLRNAGITSSAKRRRPSSA